MGQNDNDNMQYPHYIEEDLAIRLPNHEILSTGVTPEVVKFYASYGTKVKQKIDQAGAEVSQRQEKMAHLNNIISEINNLTDDKNGLDIRENQELQKWLQVARDLGVKIPDKLVFDSVGRDRLVENLHLSADNWDKENKSQTQKMEICIKELDRILMMLKEVQKDEDRPKRAITAGIKGG